MGLGEVYSVQRVKAKLGTTEIFVLDIPAKWATRTLFTTTHICCHSLVVFSKSDIWRRGQPHNNLHGDSGPCGSMFKSINL